MDVQKQVVKALVLGVAVGALLMGAKSARAEGEGSRCSKTVAQSCGAPCGQYTYFDEYGIRQYQTTETVELRLLYGCTPVGAVKTDNCNEGPVNCGESYSATDTTAFPACRTGQPEIIPGYSCD